MRWLLIREPETESKRRIAREGVPSVSPTLWPTERAHREGAPGRHPVQDITLPDIQTHLQSVVTVAESDPHSSLYLIFVHPFCFNIIYLT